MSGDGEGAAALRELVDAVTVGHGPAGLSVTITGRLNPVLGEKAFPNAVRASVGKLVAEEGFEPPTHGL